jgi:hypothetical protein
MPRLGMRKLSNPKYMMVVKTEGGALALSPTAASLPATQRKRILRAIQVEKAKGKHHQH